MKDLTYDELRAMAVSPSEAGAYGNSPLGEDTGLHVHGSGPEADVHVYVAGFGKIAEVFPGHTFFCYRENSVPEAVRELWRALPGHREPSFE